MYIFPIAIGVCLLLLYLRATFLKRNANVLDKSIDSLTIILGSGGHTSELFLLLKDFDFERNKISVIHAVMGYDGDILSEKKLYQQKWANKVAIKIHKIARGRFVGAGFIQSIPHFMYLCLQSVSLAWKIFMPKTLIICNGPAICVPLTIMGFLIRSILPCYGPSMVYVESFARVNNLSLSGRILYLISDKFVVQWPHLKHTHNNALYLGKLI